MLNWGKYLLKSLVDNLKGFIFVLELNNNQKPKIMNNYERQKQDDSVSVTVAIIIITISFLIGCLADNL